MTERVFEPDSPPPPPTNTGQQVAGGPWYLLYGGSSADGMGPGRYDGRTSDLATAQRHHAAISDDPYSTGYVLIVTDKQIQHVHAGWRWP